MKKTNVILDSDDDDDADIVDKNGKESVVVEDMKEPMPGSKTVIKCVKKEGVSDSAKPELTFSDLVNNLAWTMKMVFKFNFCCQLFNKRVG